MAKIINSLLNKSLQKLKDFILDDLQDSDITVIHFGSRVRGDSSVYSDIDIGILAETEKDRKKITLMRDKIEDLNIPYKIDIVDLSSASAEFKDKVLEEGEIWKKQKYC